MAKVTIVKVIDILEKSSGILIGILGACILFRKLFTVSPEQVLWADNFDSKLMYWIVNWGYHILFEAKQPLNFWNANSFFPESQTLAYSESSLSIQLLFSPLRAIGIPPFTSLYLSLAGFTIIGCFLTERALRRLKIFSTLEIMLIVFSTHFSLSFINFLNHYQLFGFHLAPAFFLYLFLFLKEFKKIDLIMTCCLFCIGTAFSTYLAPMEISLAVVMVIPSLIFSWREIGIVRFFRKLGWSSAVIGISFALLLYFIQLKPYLSKLDTSASPNLNEYISYSASPISIFKNISISSFWYGTANFNVMGEWEYSYFPGYILLLPGLFFIIFLIGSTLLDFIQKIHSHKILSDPFSQQSKFILYILIFFFLIWILSFGPVIKRINLPNPVYWLFVEVIPGMANIRAPGRFGIWFGFPLSIFIIFLIRKLKLNPLSNQVIILVLLTFVVIESLPNHSIFPFSIDPQEIYKKTALLISPGTPLIELPIAGKDFKNTLDTVQNQLDGSTIHWARLVVGYGAKTSPEFNEILNIDNQIRRGGEIQPMVDFAHKKNISYFLIHLPDYQEKTQTQWKKISSESSSNRLIDENGYILFQITP